MRERRESTSCSSVFPRRRLAMPPYGDGSAMSGSVIAPTPFVGSGSMSGIPNLPQSPIPTSGTMDEGRPLGRSAPNMNRLSGV